MLLLLLHSTSENTALGRTARERWKLFKNVTKLGLLRSTSCTSQQSTTTTTGVSPENNGAGSDAIDMATEMKATSAENILAADDGEDDDEYNIMPAVSVNYLLFFFYSLFKYWKPNENLN